MIAAKKITLAITGASGVVFATNLLAELLKSNCIVHLVISKAGVITLHHELGIALAGSPQLIKQKLVSELNLTDAHNLFVYGIEDWYAPIASGSSVDEAMPPKVVVGAYIRRRRFVFELMNSQSLVSTQKLVNSPGVSNSDHSLKVLKYHDAFATKIE